MISSCFMRGRVGSVLRACSAAFSAAFLAAFLVPAAASAQPAAQPIADSVRVVLDSTMALMQRHSLNSRSVDWPTVRATAYARAAGAQTVPAAAPAIAYLFEALGDFHGAFYYGDEEIKWKRPGPSYPTTASAGVLEQIKRGPKFFSTRLPHDIGYVRIPNLMMDTARWTPYAQMIQDSIGALHARRPLRGLIVDLRVNPGGTMYPMIAGLAPVLGTGEVGSFRTADGRIIGRWLLNGGNLYIEHEFHTHLAHPVTPLPATLPVAVLTSPMTGSAGEDVAIALHGRPHTRFFGERTAGYTTANNGYMLHGKAGVNLATSLAADRTGQLFPHDLTPDEFIAAGDNFLDLGKDAKVKAALRWLRHPGAKARR